MQVQENKVFDDAENFKLNHLQLQPLTLDFDIDAKATPGPEGPNGCSISSALTSQNLTSSYNYSLDMKQFNQAPGQYTPDALVQESTVTGQGTQLTTSSITLGRNISTCDASQVLIDTGFAGGNLPNTIDVWVSVAFPTVSTTTMTGQQPTTQPGTTPESFEVVFNYDYTQSSNSQSVPPPAQVLQGTGTMWNSIKQYGYNCQLTAKQLGLEYHPVDRDLRGEVNSMTGLRWITNNLAKDDETGTWFLHANNQLWAYVDGNDVTDSGDLVTWRWERAWEAPLPPLAQPPGPSPSSVLTSYASSASLASGPHPPIPLWGDDNLHKIQAWKDIPGDAILPADPSKWEDKRELNEFVASVYQFPEFEFLYYIVVYDLHPNAYRVRAYSAQDITVDTWCKIKTLQQPYMTDKLFQTVELDSGWCDSKGNPIS